MIDISKWCGLNDQRTYLNQPFNVNGKTWASNGHVLIAVGLRPEYDDNELPPNRVINTLAEMIEGGLDYGQHVPMALPEKADCEQCKGVGKYQEDVCEECDGECELEFESSCNHYTVECRSCKGNGYLGSSGGEVDCDDCLGNGKRYNYRQTIKVRDKAIQAKYYELLLNIGEPLEVSSVKNRLCFRSLNSVGAIMSTRV